MKATDYSILWQNRGGMYWLCPPQQLNLERQNARLWIRGLAKYRIGNYHYDSKTRQGRTDLPSVCGPLQKKIKVYELWLLAFLSHANLKKKFIIKIAQTTKTSQKSKTCSSLQFKTTLKCLLRSQNNITEAYCIFTNVTNLSFKSELGCDCCAVQRLLTMDVTGSLHKYAISLRGILIRNVFICFLISINIPRDKPVSI